MTLQVLISTMNQTDHSLLERMNIQSDAIVINQCDRNESEEFIFRGHKIRWFSFNERGVGLSRNSAWMRADADIILFADDDLCYADGYPQKLLHAFEQMQRQDMIIFDVEILNDHREVRNYRKIEKAHPLHWYNSMRYGACRIAVRRKSLLKNNVCFSLLFGGGASYSSGEDSLFIKQCLERKMKIVAFPMCIAKVDSGQSTWYEGVTEKYFIDKGILLYAAFPIIYPLLYLYYAWREKKHWNGFFSLLKVFYKGRREYIER